MATMIRSLWLVCVAVCLFGCSPQPDRALEICRARTQVEAQGRGLDPEDRAELVEACMLDRGWALREEGARCLDNATTPNNPQCYHPNTFWGWLYSRVRK